MKEKLQQAMQLLQECMSECGDEEDMEDEESSSEEEGESSMGGNDKVKMAVALMKRAK